MAKKACVHRIRSEHCWSPDPQMEHGKGRCASGLQLVFRELVFTAVSWQSPQDLLGSVVQCWGFSSLEAKAQMA